MAITSPNENTQLQLATLLPLSTRLTIGSAVCFAEGLFTALMLMVPQNRWYYIIGALLTLATWLAFWRFRDTKMGADIIDLCFIDFAVRTIVPLLSYVIVINVDYFWYSATALSMLKIIRVYIWQTSATQQHGWGTFGFMTWHYAKRYAPKTTPTLVPTNGKLLAEIIAILMVAVFFSVGIKRLEDYERVIFMWTVPFAFEFFWGPIQLRKLKIFGGLLSTKDEQITELTEKLALAEAKNELLREMGNLPDEECVALINAYRVLPKEKQIGLIQWAKLMAKNFGLPASDSDTK